MNDNEMQDNPRKEDEDTSPEMAGAEGAEESAAATEIDLPAAGADEDTAGSAPIDEDTPGFVPPAEEIDGILPTGVALEEDELANIIEPENPLPDFVFEQLSEPLREVVARQGWLKPMPVQRKAIPYLLAGQDIIVQSRTGSGKTGAFLLPLLEIIEPSHAHPQAIILVPTRELAIQVGREAELFGAARGIRHVVLYGGVGYDKQLEDLHNGAHIVVGTPGRVIDHLQRGNIHTDSIRDLVMDEADEMLGMGFYPDMQRIKSYLPRDRCTYLFSATITDNVRNLAREFQRAPKFLGLSHQVSFDRLTHEYVVVDPMKKDETILGILEHDHPESAFIFCNMKRDVTYLCDFLRSHGLDVEGLSGDLSQAAREKILAKFRDKELRYMVATDVAARGIDISNVSHVILHDQPQDPEVYVHRVGRTARAGKSGTAISVVGVYEELALKAIGRKFNIRFEKRVPLTGGQITEMVLERMVAHLERGVREAPRSVVRNAERMMPVIAGLCAEPDTRMGMALVLAEIYQREFHGQGEAVVRTPAPGAPGSDVPRHRDRDRGGDRGARPRRRR